MGRPMIPRTLMDGIDAMAKRIEVLEEENRRLKEETERLSGEKELCMREIMRQKMLLDAGRTRR